MTTISLTIFLSSACYFIANDFAGSLGAQAKEASSLFLIGIAPDELDPVKQKLAKFGDSSPLVAPMVFSRMTSVKGIPIQKILEEKNISDRKRRFLTRETNLSYSWQMTDSETLIRGEYWEQDEKDDLSIERLSVEEEFASELGLDLGDEIVFDIQGVEVKAKVTSIRSVKWQSLRPNFFIKMHPKLGRSSSELCYVFKA